MLPAPLAQDRVDWVDYAKGWCIILVVMMHSTLGVEDALGQESWLHGFIAWARPFRMPDFFLVAGLFLSRTIDRPWRDFLDRKVLHFAYFYLLWTVIQGVPKLLFSGDARLDVASGLAFALIEPFGTLWFIYLLPVFFVVTKRLRRVPAQAVLIVACALQIANIETGSTVIDEFAGRFIYCFAGYAFAPQIFAFADAARAKAGKTIALLFLWGAANGLAVRFGYAALPGVSLILGFAGAGAVVAFSALLAQARILPALRWLGGRSIVVYLAFAMPMAAIRLALLRSGLIEDPGTMALIVAAGAIVVPLGLQRLVTGGQFSFLFERPAAFRLKGRLSTNDDTAQAGPSPPPVRIARSSMAPRLDKRTRLTPIVGEAGPARLTEARGGHDPHHAFHRSG
ncbi:MAG: acyltransferase [Methylocystis sp.]|nr:MAG: acyltransferase [Methylocystis sp.]